MKGETSEEKRNQVPGMKDRLRALMMQYESQAAFANALGISRQTVGFWLSGRRVPDAANLLIISEKTGKSVEWLLGKAPMEKQTADKTLRLVSEYTGLSEAAVTVLHRLAPLSYSGEDEYCASMRDNLSDTLSSLLSNTMFYQYVIEHFGSALMALKRAESAIDIEELSEDELDYADNLRKKGLYLQTAADRADLEISKAVDGASRFLSMMKMNEASPRLTALKEQEESLFYKLYGAEEE